MQIIGPCSKCGSEYAGTYNGVLLCEECWPCPYHPMVRYSIEALSYLRVDLPSDVLQTAPDEVLIEAFFDARDAATKRIKKYARIKAKKESNGDL